LTSNKIYPSENWQRLLSTERENRQAIQLFFQLAEPDSHEIWLDLGCGPGYFTLPLAHRVAQIFAVDISKEMLAVCRSRAEGKSIHTIKYLQSDGTRLNIEKESVHKALLSDVFHEFDDRPAVVHELFRLLRPGGSVFIIDWERMAMDFGPPLDHRLDRETVITEFEDNGFKFYQASSMYKGKYVLVFRK